MYVCVCVCVGTGELISFPSCSLRPPYQGRAKGWRGLADASKLALLEACGEGAPQHCAPPSGEKKAEGGSQQKFLARQRQLRAPPHLIRGNPAASVPGTTSPAHATAEPRLKEPAAGSAAPFRPPRSRLWDRGARLAVDGRAPARARRRGAAQPPTDERLTADAGYLSVRPRVGRPTGSACWLGAGARGTRPSPSPPGSSTGFCPEGGHFPTLPLPLLAKRAAGGLRGPELPAPHPAPRFSSRPLSPATFRALFSGWK